MSRWALLAVALSLAALLGWFVASRRAPAPLPDTPAVVQRIRDVARLETLDVALYKKIDFAPDPQPSDSVWGAVAQWARHTLRPPRGKAIVFADAHLSIDLRKLDERTLRAQGHRVQAVLPRTETRIELRPGETEVIGSNLDSAETALLLEQAKGAFQRAVDADAGLQERARESARRALRVLLLQLGFSEVEFVSELPRGQAG
jgi:hypothetical protein